MFRPEDPLKPPQPVFDEAWQAQVLGIADAMVQAGHFSARDWAEALGANLSAAEASGKADTLETYYLAALSALEELCAATGITPDTQARRKQDWTAAYLNTPHGQPVTLDASDKAMAHSHE